MSEFGGFSFYFQDVVEDGYVWNGKSLTVPGAYGAPTKTRCIAYVGDRYKIFTLKLWEGNGFGNSVRRFVVNVETGSIYVIDDVYAYTSVLESLRELVKGRVG